MADDVRFNPENSDGARCRSLPEKRPMMAKIMKTCALVTTLATVLCALLHSYLQMDLLLTLTLTFGTTAYHFVMRLLVGWTVDRIFRNRLPCRAGWFRVRPFEQKLYSALKLKKWKAHIPTYDPSLFDRRLHSWEEIAQASCQAELVHEGIMVLSLLPILAAIPFGEFWVFFITSLLAACLDALFVILQRYNRPRLLNLINRQAK